MSTSLDLATGLALLAAPKESQTEKMISAAAIEIFLHESFDVSKNIKNPPRQAIGSERSPHSMILRKIYGKMSHHAKPSYKH